VNPVPPELTPEESRYLDGLLDPEALRRFEAQLATDPERRERLDAWKRAMALWQDDVERVAATFDADALTERVLRMEGEQASGWGEFRSARRYAAAALLLIGVGVFGAAWVGPQPMRNGFASTSNVMRLMEEEQIDLQADLEMLTLPGEHIRLESGSRVEGDGQR
jgi:anti-sigma factor RsiW